MISNIDIPDVEVGATLNSGPFVEALSYLVNNCGEAGK